MNVSDENKQIEAVEALAAQLREAGYEVSVFKDHRFYESFGRKRHYLHLSISADKPLPTV
jgi:hypothetical protein